MERAKRKLRMESEMHSAAISLFAAFQALRKSSSTVCTGCSGCSERRLHRLHPAQKPGQGPQPSPTHSQTPPFVLCLGLRRVSPGPPTRPVCAFPCLDLSPLWRWPTEESRARCQRPARTHVLPPCHLLVVLSVTIKETAPDTGAGTGEAEWHLSGLAVPSQPG